MNLLGGFIIFKMAQNFVGSFAEAAPDSSSGGDGLGSIIGFLLWWGFAICVYIVAGCIALGIIGGGLYVIGIVLLKILGVVFWPFQELYDFLRIVIF